MYCIYKLYNQNDEIIYIGLTRRPDKRLAEHQRYSRTKKSKFYNKVRQMGYQIERMEIIETHKKAIDARIAEIKYIIEHFCQSESKLLNVCIDRVYLNR